MHKVRNVFLVLFNNFNLLSIRHLFAKNYTTKTIWKIQMFVHVDKTTRKSVSILI